jgi:hypothetical protein
MGSCLGTKQFSVAVTIYICISKEPSSNLDQATGYPEVICGFPRSLQPNASNIRCLLPTSFEVVYVTVADKTTSLKKVIEIWPRDRLG